MEREKAVKEAEMVSERVQIALRNPRVSCFTPHHQFSYLQLHQKEVFAIKREVERVCERV